MPTTPSSTRPLAEHYGIPWTSSRSRVERLASRGRDQAIRPRRHPRPGDDPGQAIRRLAHQPDPARQLDQRGLARRTAAATAQGRAAAARRRSRDRGPDRAAARRKAHAATPKCAVCHRRIDPFGFALEGFDAIGRRREKDLGGRPIDTHARSHGRTHDSTGLDGLRTLPAHTTAATPSCDSSAASCWATPWAAPCSFPTNRCWPRCRPT